MRVFLVLLALFAVVFAQQHTDSTVVTVENGADVASDHFLISVDHIEDLVGANGELLAERDIRVAIRFDAFHGSYLVNGAKVDLGFNQVKVKAHVMEVEASGQPRPFDQIVKVNLRVFVGLRQIELEDGTVVDGVYMQERVVGIQETEFWQADVIEQVFIIRQDGTISRHQIIKVDVLQGEHLAQDLPLPADVEAPETPMIDPNHGFGDTRPPQNGFKPHFNGMRPNHHGNHGFRRPGQHHGHHGHHGSEYGQGEDGQGEDSLQPPAEGPDGSTQNWIEDEKQVIEKEIQEFLHKASRFFERSYRWFSSLPAYQRLLISFAAGLTISIVVMGILRCLACCCCSSKKKSCQSCQNCKASAPANNYKENIRVYSLQYTAVPQDEKDAKKQEGSIEMV